MIENLSELAEVGEKAAESKSSFDPDAKIAKREVSPGSEAKNSEKPYNPDDKVEKAETKGLSDEQKEQIKKETGWSDEIVDSIGSMAEYKIYKDAGLVEAEVNGKKCLINPNIDMNQTDQFGRTNKERMEQGLAPLNKDGKPIELHHIGQHPDSPLAELTQEQHRGKGNDSILHDKTKESEIDRQVFGQERSDHWKSRAEGGK